MIAVSSTSFSHPLRLDIALLFTVNPCIVSCFVKGHCICANDIHKIPLNEHNCQLYGDLKIIVFACTGWRHAVDDASEICREVGEVRSKVNQCAITLVFFVMFKMMFKNVTTYHHEDFKIYDHWAKLVLKLSKFIIGYIKNYRRVDKIMCYV